VGWRDTIAHIGEGIAEAADNFDSITGAPARKAVDAALSGENPLTAFAGQFGMPTDTAPSGAEIAEKRLGISAEPRPMRDAFDQEIEGAPALPSGAGMVGAGIDLAADPTLLAGPAIKGAENASQAGKTLFGALREMGEAGRVGKLDMSEAARLARAKEMGFNTEQTFYHGTKGNIESFAPEMKGGSTNAGSAKQGFFFASDPSTASDYANLGKSQKELRLRADSDSAIDAYSGYYNKLKTKYGDNFSPQKLSNKEYDKLQSLKDSAKELALKNRSETSPVVGWGHEEANDYLSKKLDDLQRTQESSRANLARLEKEVAEGTANGWAGAYDPEAFSKKKMDDLRIHRSGVEARDELIKETQEGLAKTQEFTTGQNVIPVHLKTQNPYIHDFKGMPYRDTSYAEIMAEAKNKGHDSVVFKNTFDPADPTNIVKQDIVTVFEPNQIRSVNAKFDPAKKKSGNILAGGAAALAGGSMLAGEDANAAERGPMSGGSWRDTVTDEAQAPSGGGWRDSIDAAPAEDPTLWDKVKTLPGAFVDELMKPLPPGEDNPLLSASIPAEGIPAAGMAARSLFGKFAGKLGGAAESFATSPLPGKIQSATNITGQAKGFLGKIAPALPENLKKYSDLATGLAGRSAVYHSPLAPVQAVSDIAKGVQGAEGMVAKGIVAVPTIASKLAPAGRSIGIVAQAGAGR